MRLYFIDYIFDPSPFFSFTQSCSTKKAAT
nr:MAG TPA: hypothetical protein [Caudoviricetes sp.]